jgi:hypothetical protein
VASLTFNPSALGYQNKTYILQTLLIHCVTNRVCVRVLLRYLGFYYGTGVAHERVGGWG